MKKLVLIVTLAALVIVGVAAFVIPKVSGGDSVKTQAGECVVVDNHEVDRADVSSAACASEKAIFKVGKVLADTNANCPDTGDEYTTIVPSSGGGKLCLLPNLVEGGCYQPHEDDEGWGKSSCVGAETVKVTKVISGAGDTAECPESEAGQDMVFPEPPVTYCLDPVKP